MFLKYLIINYSKKKIIFENIKYNSIIITKRESLFEKLGVHFVFNDDSIIHTQHCVNSARKRNFMKKILLLSHTHLRRTENKQRS